MNEKLQEAAKNYVEIIKQLKEAEQALDKASERISTLRKQKTTADVAMKDFVGKNIRRKMVILENGTVVLVEYNGEEQAYVSVFEEGEEIT